MAQGIKEHTVLRGLDMASLVLGMIGSLLFFMPVLGIPISGFGLLCGIAGCVAACAGLGPTLRWSLGGTAFCALALAINWGMYYAPYGYLPPREVPPLWNPAKGRPWVSPPAP